VSAPRALWLAGGALLVLLAWQGHHLAHWLPGFERMIEGLGPWGPLAFCAALLLLEPLFVPDTLFALAAGVAFGPVAGTLYYGAAVYAACLAIQWLGARWLRAPALRALARSPRIRELVERATVGGPRRTFLVRLVPVNQALLSYALGAAGVPLRNAFVGNLGMFPHMLPTLYFGAAAVHVTRMAGTHHTAWERDAILGMLALGAGVALALWLIRSARSSLGVAGAQPDA
jgi:uncharacterized membrane protein YdjX (TVP38/TMEM64 family)